MKTITLEEPGRFVLSEGTAPGQPAAGEAVVRVHRVGVCGTDIHAFTGKQPFFTYPRILGHELAVEVIAMGPADESGNPQGVKVGDRCSVEPYVNCQKCIACRRGKSNCCANLRVIGVHFDGGMRERFALPVRKLHPANRLSFEQIALVETLGIGAHAVQRAALQPDETVLVIGAGPIGLSVIQFAAVQARTIVMDVSESRLAFCREKLGIKDVIDARSDPTEKLKALTNGDMPAAVIDATGSAQSMNGALKYMAHGGRLVYVGLFQGDFALSDPEFHRRETTLMGSRNALPADFTRIIAMIEAGKIDTAPWITHRVEAGNLAETFPKLLEPGSGVLKAMIEF
ncbi:MAG TPA: zinc-binding alcohol dehydrogenase family protein [Phycisphaerae bacterium]|jgi:2-desacetyl-2-hydroxyethyl bacteriochlorophyllide A dehydrogenase